MKKDSCGPPRPEHSKYRLDLVAELIDSVSSEFGVSPKAVRGRTRVEPVALARKHVWIRMHVDLGWSVREIAKRFMRHHTTVYQAIRGRQKPPRMGVRR